jgi:hypothetical protein
MPRDLIEVKPSADQLPLGLAMRPSAAARGPARGPHTHNTTSGLFAHTASLDSHTSIQASAPIERGGNFLVDRQAAFNNEY